MMLAARIWLLLSQNVTLLSPKKEETIGFFKNPLNFVMSLKRILISTRIFQIQISDVDKTMETSILTTPSQRWKNTKVQKRHNDN